MISRRTFLSAATLSTLGASDLISLIGPSRASTSVVAGAIRWDAWDAAQTHYAKKAVEESLGPAKYQSRAPWFARPKNSYSIAIDGNQQTIMDAEITYAKNAGLNYWAYCWYGSSDFEMQNAWGLHQSSKIKNKINWCMILQFTRMEKSHNFASVCAKYVEYFSQKNYQKVLGNRPLLYIFIDSASTLAVNWGGSWSNVQSALNQLRSACTDAGLATPYIVILHGTPSIAQSIMSQVSADAISNYTAALASGQPASYASQDNAARNYWASEAATGAPIVPICQTGWDTRPRKEHPPSFSHSRSLGSMQSYVSAGTPEQIADHVYEAIKYISANGNICPARTLLIYSWNECDEGGSALIPTFTDQGPNTSILDAVAKVLNSN